MRGRSDGNMRPRRSEATERGSCVTRDLLPQFDNVEVPYGRMFLFLDDYDTSVTLSVPEHIILNQEVNDLENVVVSVDPIKYPNEGK